MLAQLQLFERDNGVVGAPFVHIELKGAPVGWARTGVRVIQPKAGRAFASIYKKSATRTYENKLAQVAALAMIGKPTLAGPLAMRITATMPVPKSWPNKRRAAALLGLKLPITKPDWDNIGGMTDALKGIVWNDDSQACRVLVVKCYGPDPSLVVDIWPLTGE